MMAGQLWVWSLAWPGLADNIRPIYVGKTNLHLYLHTDSFCTFVRTPNEAVVTSRLCILAGQLHLLYESAAYLKQSGLK